MAMDLFDLGDTPQKLAAKLRRCAVPLAAAELHQRLALPALPVAGDGRRPDRRRQAGQLLQRRRATAATTPSCCPTNLDILRRDDPRLPGPTSDGCGPRAGRRTATRRRAADEPAASRSPTSIFHRRRLDYDSILELIPPGPACSTWAAAPARCWPGSRQRGHRRIMGIELDEQAILACIRRGLDVVQADLNQGLAAFADRQFDFVVLSQTLQAVLDVERVLADMLRVGRRGIVSFPNLGYRKLRAAALPSEGRAPRAGSLLGYQLVQHAQRPFPHHRRLRRVLPRARGSRIHQRIALDTDAGVEVHDDPNLNADMAIVVISK